MKEDIESNPPKGVDFGTEVIEGKRYTVLTCKAPGITVKGRYETGSEDGDRALTLTITGGEDANPEVLKDLLEQVLLVASDNPHVKKLQLDSEETLAMVQRAFAAADGSVDFGAGFAALEGKQEAVLDIENLLAPFEEKAAGDIPAPKKAA